MNEFSPMGAATVVAATASNVAGAFTMPAGATCIHIANTSATLYVSVAMATSSASTTLGGSLSLPPMSQIVVAANPKVASVSAIGSGAGPTAVVFTPGRCG
jgi:hypothetical protein